MMRTAESWGRQRRKKKSPAALGLGRRGRRRRGRRWQRGVQRTSDGGNPTTATAAVGRRRGRRPSKQRRGRCAVLAVRLRLAVKERNGGIYSDGCEGRERRPTMTNLDSNINYEAMEGVGKRRNGMATRIQRPEEEEQRKRETWLHRRFLGSLSPVGNEGKVDINGFGSDEMILTPTKGRVGRQEGRRRRQCWKTEKERGGERRRQGERRERRGVGLRRRKR